MKERVGDKSHKKINPGNQVVKRLLKDKTTIAMIQEATAKEPRSQLADNQMHLPNQVKEPVNPAPLREDSERPGQWRLDEAPTQQTHSL